MPQGIRVSTGLRATILRQRHSALPIMGNPLGRAVPTAGPGVPLLDRGYRGKQGLEGENVLHLGADLVRGTDNMDARRRKRLKLRLRRIISPTNDRPRMAHPAAWRSRRPGDERHHRLLHIRLHPIRRVNFRTAPNLPDHHHGIRVLILIEQLQTVYEVRAVQWIATDSDASRLPHPQGRELEHRLIRQRAAS